MLSGLQTAHSDPYNLSRTGLLQSFPSLKLEIDRLDKYPATTGGLSGKGVYDLMNNEKMTQDITVAPAPKDRSALVRFLNNHRGSAPSFALESSIRL